jgi:hypothetical protein
VRLVEIIALLAALAVGFGLGRLRRRALEEGIPYQTLLASILHKYAAGGLVEKDA